MAASRKRKQTPLPDETATKTEQVVKIIDGRLCVSNQPDPNNKQDEQSPFAPRQARDSNDKERRPEAPRLVNSNWTEFRDRLPNAANLQEPGHPPWMRQRLAEGEFPEDKEESSTNGDLPPRR